MDIAVVGAGAAGLFAAISAAGTAAKVTLYEKNKTCGKKLLITGKGRCNLTNDCEIWEMASNIPRGAKFLQSAFSFFSPRDTIEFFESCDVKLKTERGARVFPVSDKAEDIQKCLVKKIESLPNVTLEISEVSEIKKNNDGKFSVVSLNGEAVFDRVIIATGGLSYPRTGSTGDGYRFAKAFGHNIVKTRPVLVPLVCREKVCAEMMGLSLKNVSVRFFPSGEKKCVYEDFGELLFTHFGVSGPVILSASSHLDDIGRKNYTLKIDLKPALTPEQLDKRIIGDFMKYSNRDFINSLSDLLPLKMIAPVVKLSGIPERVKTNEITKAQRKTLVELLKAFTLTVVATRPVEEAVVTSGGVDLKEINSKTMESKLCPGLYFAGELIDADAYTGGFNLQIAFSTGMLAGFFAGQNQ